MKKLVLLMLLALPLAAEEQLVFPVVVSPPQPSTDLPVELRFLVNCAAGAPQFTREGSLIRISYASFFLCDPPIPFFEVVAYPELLPAGDYQVEVLVDGRNLPEAVGTFSVRDAQQAPFAVRPSAVPANITSRLRMRLELLGGFDCAGDCTVSVDGAVVPHTVVAPRVVSFLAPPHDPGFVSVTVEHEDAGTFEIGSALYYYDTTEPPSETFFQRVFFPLLFDAPGSSSHWRTDAVISNPKPWWIATYNSIRPDCAIETCSDRIAPGEHAKFTNGAHPRGVALFVPFRESEELSFALRARDVSRQARSYGVEIPVLRERELFRDTMTLLDVPLDARFRAKLRVYAFQNEGLFSSSKARITMRNPETSQQESFELELDDHCPTTCTAAPAYAEVDLPAGSTGRRVNLYVDPPNGSLSWAFVTVTNNATQQVTIVTPNGEGGTACNPCAIP